MFVLCCFIHVFCTKIGNFHSSVAMLKTLILFNSMTEKNAIENIMVVAIHTAGRVTTAQI